MSTDGAPLVSEVSGFVRGQGKAAARSTGESTTYLLRTSLVSWVGEREKQLSATCPAHTFLTFPFHSEQVHQQGKINKLIKVRLAPRVLPMCRCFGRPHLRGLLSWQPRLLLPDQAIQMNDLLGECSSTFFQSCFNLLLQLSQPSQQQALLFLQVLLQLLKRRHNPLPLRLHFLLSEQKQSSQGRVGAQRGTGSN